jgi:hypothetical protein
VTAPSQASRRQASGSRGRCRCRRPGGAALEAVQVHRDRQLGPDPTTLGQVAALQGAAGQLAQGISPALAAAARVAGTGGAGQRLQGRQQALTGLGFQQAIHCDHAVQGGGQPEAPPLVALLGLAGGGVGVGHQPPVGDDPSQPG